MQGYSTALVNSQTSFNHHVEPILAEIATALSLPLITTPEGEVRDYAIGWHPMGQAVTEFPSVRSTFLRKAWVNKKLNRFESLIQLDVFCHAGLLAGGDEDLANAIAGQLLERLGFDPEDTELKCPVPQYDYAANQEPLRKLQEMDLELQTGWETGPDEDPDVVHLMATFLLIFY